MSTKVVTGKVRFSYAHVFEKHAAAEGQTPKYSVSLLIPKKDIATLEKIEKGIDAAMELAKGKWGGKIPKKLKLPLRDGDEEKEDDDNYKGMMFLNCSTDKQPGVLDENRNEIMDKSEFYSGCFGRASINFYGFNVSGNQGIAVGLNAVQKLQDGEPLGGAGWSANDFDDDDDIM